MPKWANVGCSVLVTLIMTAIASAGIIILANKLLPSRYIGLTITIGVPVFAVLMFWVAISGATSLDKVRKMRERDAKKMRKKR
jgi:hypothetical protein